MIQKICTSHITNAIGEIMETKTPRELANELKKTMQCNCDLDNWEPERDTGHSWVCRIHKEVKRMLRSDS